MTSSEVTNTQQPLPPKTETPTNSTPTRSTPIVEQRSNTPKRQWSPQRTSTPPTAAATSPQFESQSPKPSARVESPFSSQQPNPLLPKPLSPIKMDNLNGKPVESQKQPEEVLSRQQRELIHQQDVLEQIRKYVYDVFTNNGRELFIQIEL